MITVRLSCLRLYAHHGVTETERELGQWFELDVELETEESASTSDAIQDTIDYTEVCALMTRIVSSTRYCTLERLSHVIAEQLLSDFPTLMCGRIRITKPAPPVDYSLNGLGVERKFRR